MAERWQYLELRSALGGTCLGFMMPIGGRRRLSVNGDDAFSFNIQADHRLVPQIEKGKIVREVLSVDGATWREWEVKDYRLGAVLMFIECRPIMEMLKAYPVHLVDGDGYVYTDAPAIQLPPATMISSRILSTTPAIFGLGTVTPTALGEVPFSGDNARSGLLRMEEIFPPYNAQLRWSATQYLVDFIQIGAGAPILYLRDMKNIVAIEKRTTQDHINRLTQIRGADGDDGPTGIAWAYWEVEATRPTPNLVLQSEALNASPWSNASDGTNTGDGITADTTLAPDGTTSADTITITATASGRAQSVSFIGDGTKAISVYLKQSTPTTTDLQLFDATASIVRHGVRVTWSGGVPALTTVNGTGTLFTPTDVPGFPGWYRIAFAPSGVIAANSNVVYIIPANVIGNSVIAWGVQAENAATPGPYIKRGSSADFLVKLKAIHGGDGPIKFDNQFNHANLPGGADSLYLETAGLTYLQITGSVAATQELKAPVTTGLTAGDRVRICASATGKHLTFLDAPAEIALYGVQPGAFESGYDDTHTVNKNAMQAAWATPASLPDGWTGLGAQTTTAADVISSGKALLINQSVADGAQIAAPPAAVVKIRARQTKWCATAWIKLKAAFGAGGITFQLKANGVVVGAGLLYGAPSTYTVGVYRQLILRGLDLSALVGTSPSLVAEIIKSGGTGTVNMVVDDICLTPSISERAACDGSNDARTWQEANRFLDAARASYYQWPVTDADLARNGITAEAGASLGGTVVMETEKYGTVSARILQINDVPEDPSQGASYEISTLPPRFSRAKVKPAEFLIPFGVPQEVTTAQVGEANAVLIVKVITPFTQTATQVTVNLTVMDTRGGAPVVTAVALGGASIASGSGAGPWVINKPAAGAGIGRVVWTAHLDGRTDVWDAVDVPEQAPAAGLVYNEVRTAITGVTATTVSVTVTAVAPSGTPTVQLVSVGGSASLNTGPAIGVPAASGQVWVFNRGAFQSGLGDAVFRAVFAGNVSDDDSIAIADQGRDTVAVTTRLRVLTSTATQVVVRVAMSDPIPQGAGTGSLSYLLSTGVVTVTPATPQTVTPAATITEAAGTYVDFTITRPLNGQGTGRVVFTAAAANRISDSDSVEVPEQGSAIIYTEVRTAITAIDTTTVTITVTGIAPSGFGTPTVQLFDLNGTATLNTGLAIGVPGASPQVWKFNRGAFESGLGEAIFRTVLTGAQSDDDSVMIPEVGRDTVAVTGRCRVLSSTDTQVVVRTAMSDPFPQGAASGLISYQLSPSVVTISPAISTNVTPAATITEAAGTYVDWTVTRPVFGAGAGRVTFTFAAAISANRISDTDSIDVPEQLLPGLTARATLVSTSATQIVVQVAVADADPPGGASVTVNWNAGALTVTPATGGTLTPTNSLATTGAIAYTITRPAFATGSGLVAFTATATGRIPSAVSVIVPAVERDTIALSARATLITTNPTTVVYRVAVIDPIPPGGASVTSTWFSTNGGVTPASGGTLTPTADFATTGVIDYTIDRPPAVVGGVVAIRRVQFTATATGRTSATDSVDVPAQDAPALDLKAEWVSDTQWKITWVATGTVEVSLNGAAYAAPGITSGVAFTRPAYGAKDDVHAFRVTSGGLVISNTITVPAQVVLSPVLTVSLPAVGAGSTVDFAWTFSGMPSGVVFAANYTAFNSAGALTGAAGTATGLTASPWNQTPSPARATGDYYTITITAEYQGKVLATRTRTGVLT